MSLRTSTAVAVVLVAMLAAGGATAWVTGGRSSTGPAPLGSAREVPDEGAGSGVVELSADTATHPAREAVRIPLQRHFDAINSRDYEAWRGTVVPERSEGLGAAAWQQAYGSTRDGTIRIDRIDEGPDGSLLVRVRFISTQDLADAPADMRAERICWRSTLPMTGSPPRIAMTRGGSSVATAC